MDNYSNKLNNLIPGGAHTYSRGFDQFPENAPSILAYGKGCYTWDANGEKYLDYGMALRSVAVGYAYESIAEAAFQEIMKGNNLTRPSLIELEAAETITDLIPCAEMVKFAKNGSTVTTAAVKLARAYTGRKLIAICEEHPFLSYDDWFIATTCVDKGIPGEFKPLVIKFKYNDFEMLKQIFNKYDNKIAAVIMEPVTYVPPENDFLQKVKEICQRNGTIFILDEMITGFRWDLRGAQTYFNIIPDLATFGKAMANGFSVAALVGKREIMDLGGICNKGKDRVFLISTTHGAEMCGLGAFVETLNIYTKLNVIGHLWDFGKKLIDGINSIAKRIGILEYFYIEGYPCSPYYVCKDMNKNISLEFRTLFSQEMIKSKILMPWIALSLAHGNDELEYTLESVEKALNIYKYALNEGVEKYLKGSSIKPVFRKYN